MPKLAILILTWNEENDIGGCIDSVAFADEIIVVDSGSTDRTVPIAQQRGAKIVTRAMDNDFAAQRNFALTCTTADWVFYLDADERIPQELSAEIQMIVQNNEPGAYQVVRRFIMYGRWMKHGGLYPDRILRLFHRSCFPVWQGTIHESAAVTSPVKELHGDLFHFGFKGWDKHLQKDNRYTSMLADQLYRRGKKSSIISIIFHPLWAFMRMYLLRGGWRDGLLGFILAAFRYHYVLMKYVKLYYYGQSLTMPGDRDEQK